MCTVFFFSVAFSTGQGVGEGLPGSHSFCSSHPPSPHNPGNLPLLILGGFQAVCVFVHAASPGLLIPPFLSMSYHLREAVGASGKYTGCGARWIDHLVGMTMCMKLTPRGGGGVMPPPHLPGLLGTFWACTDLLGLHGAGSPDTSVCPTHRVCYVDAFHPHVLLSHHPAADKQWQGVQR